MTEDNFYFRKERDARKAKLYEHLKMVTENMFRIDKPLFITFIYVEKTFNNVNRTKLKIMEAIGIDYNNTRIKYNMYIYEILVI